jgi:hypothetical protein
MPGDPVTLDLSKSQPLPGATAQPSQSQSAAPAVTLDLSKSQPINGSAGADDKPGFLSTVGSDLANMGKGVGKVFSYDNASPENQEQQEAHKTAVYNQFSSDFHAGQYQKAFTGLLDLFHSTDPNEPIGQMIDSQLAASKQAKDRMMEAAKKGDSLAVVQHAAGVIPIANQVDAAMTKYQAEPSHENLAHVVTAAIPAFVPSLVRNAGKLADVAGETASKIIPSKAAAGEVLGKVNEAIGTHPVVADEAAEVANDILDKQKTGAKLGGLKKQLQQFMDRATDPKEPLTFEEAREFDQNFRNLTTAQKMNMGAGVRPLLRELYTSLRSSIEDTADAAGQGDNFRSGMRSYRLTAQFEKVAEGLKGNVVKAGLSAAGGAAGGAGVKVAYDAYKDANK